MASRKAGTGAVVGPSDQRWGVEKLAGRINNDLAEFELEIELEFKCVANDGPTLTPALAPTVAPTWAPPGESPPSSRRKLFTSNAR